MPRSAIILIFPELAPILDEWRMRTVEDARNGVPPHITLLYPWKEAPISEVDLKAVSKLCEGNIRFKIEFNGLKYFDNGTVYFSLFNKQEVVSLSETIWAGFPETPPYAGIHENPIPHLTVAQGDSVSVGSLYANVALELGSIFPYSCEVNEVTVLEENAQGVWQTKSSIALK